jgi:hypothetical protein
MVGLVTRFRLAVALGLLVALVACTDELTVPTEPLRLLAPAWTEAYLGEPFEGALRPAGGLRPYRFELADGELPPGLSLSAGRLVGTPTEIGRYTFTILVQDGNLSQAVERVEFEVRELPTPIVRVDAPATEIRADVPLVVRVEDARAWRGARLALRWDPALFELGAPPTAGDARLVVFHDAAEGRLAIEAAALGAPRQGAFTLARFALRPVDGPARLSLEVAAVSRFAGGDHSDLRLEGAPRPGPGPADGAGDDPGDDTGDDTEPIGGDVTAPIDDDGTAPPGPGDEDPEPEGEGPDEEGEDLDPEDDAPDDEEAP